MHSYDDSRRLGGQQIYQRPNDADVDKRNVSSSSVFSRISMYPAASCTRVRSSYRHIQTTRCVDLWNWFLQKLLLPKSRSMNAHVLLANAFVPVAYATKWTGPSPTGLSPSIPRAAILASKAMLLRYSTLPGSIMQPLSSLQKTVRWSHCFSLLQMSWRRSTDSGIFETKSNGNETGLLFTRSYLIGLQVEHFSGSKMPNVNQFDERVFALLWRCGWIGRSSHLTLT